MTDGIGYFSFTLPERKGTQYTYNDIALHDLVEIFIDYDTVPATANFKGRVGKIEGYTTKDGYVRRISGLSQGEILLRRHKTNALYEGDDASDIVEEWCDDLGLGKANVTADTKEPPIDIKTKSYFDCMRQISDFYLGAVSQIKKDFYVAVNLDLYWKTRPIRTAGVETLSLGTNILDYHVTRLVEPVKNNITVYGARERTEPSSMDSWTESLTDWTAVWGDLSLVDVGERKGTYCVMCERDPGTTVSFYKAHTRLADYNYLCFWVVRGSVSNTTKKVRIMTNDVTNYFEAEIDDTNSPDWTFNQLQLGPTNEYDADNNIEGQWTKTGSPRWYNMTHVWFYHVGSDPASLYIDGDFGYTFGRFTDTATDAASIAAYGQRDLQVEDDTLHTDSACEQRAETLLYQLKDPPTQIEMTCKGNNNILVGDRLTITIPAEAISAASYDVINVEHYLNTSQKQWITRPTLMNSGNVRQSLLLSPLAKQRAMNRDLKRLERMERMIP